MEWNDGMNYRFGITYVIQQRPSKNTTDVHTLIFCLCNLHHVKLEIFLTHVILQGSSNVHVALTTNIEPELRHIYFRTAILRVNVVKVLVHGVGFDPKPRRVSSTLEGHVDNMRRVFAR